MDRGGRWIVALTGAVVALLVAVALLVERDDGEAVVSTTGPTSTSVPTIPPTAPTASTATPSIDVPGSPWWLVNRDRPLPDGYVPPDLVVPAVPLRPDRDSIELSAPAARAFEAMVADAATAGFALQLNGGYRSYEHQQELYDLYVDTYGPDAAADLVAEPGTSEHQTGLAADVGLVDLPADATFGETPASAWVAANAHRFGFVVRYPPAKADITGYRNEPWHLRHLGVGLATELFTSGRTMEEHFGLVPTPAG